MLFCQVIFLYAISRIFLPGSLRCLLPGRRSFKIVKNKFIDSKIDFLTISDVTKQIKILFFISLNRVFNVH